jgi:hypothetical protein
MQTTSLIKLERFLTFALPLLAALVGLARVVPAYGRMNHVGTLLADKQAQLAKSRTTLTTLADYPHRSLVRAVATTTEDEPIEFLVYAASMAQESQVTLLDLREAAVPAPTPASGEQASSGGSAPEKPSGIREVAITVTVEGTYSAIFSLVARLESGERIVAVSDLRVTPRDYPRLTATFTITRFVSDTLLPDPE